MGVKNLWNILGSTGQVIPVGAAGEAVFGSRCLENTSVSVGLDKPLSTLTINNSVNCEMSNSNTIESTFCGQMVAVDLSCWVCDSQANTKMQVVTQPHLRNLFFRTWSLLSVGILPVFVVEGVAPELKQATMKARNAVRSGSSSQTVKPATRRRFNSVLKECCSLLELLGVPWVQALGEAEATCAALLYNNVVNGIISEDSDVFLYGGDKVLRNFSVHNNRPTAELFTLSVIENELRLSRDSLIILALLLGCDYLPTGVPGIGATNAVRLVTGWNVKGFNPIDRFMSWVHHIPDLNSPPATLRKNSDLENLEVAVKDRACRTSNFPFSDVIEEFTRKLTMPLVCSRGGIGRLKWLQPKFDSLVKWCSIKLNWETEYAVEKASLLCCRWKILNSPCPTATSLRNSDEGNDALMALRILKVCTRKGAISYEIEWKIEVSSCAFITSREDALVKTALITLEPQKWTDWAFPDLVRIFESEKAAKKIEKNKNKGKERKRPARGKKGLHAAEVPNNQMLLAFSTTSVGNELRLTGLPHTQTSTEPLPSSEMTASKHISSERTAGQIIAGTSIAGEVTDGTSIASEVTAGKGKAGKVNIHGGFNIHSNIAAVRYDADDMKENCGHKTVLNNESFCQKCTNFFPHETKTVFDSPEVIVLDDTLGEKEFVPRNQKLHFRSDDSIDFNQTSISSDSENEKELSFLVDRFINMNVSQRMLTSRRAHVGAEDSEDLKGCGRFLSALNDESHLSLLQSCENTDDRPNIRASSVIVQDSNEVLVELGEFQSAVKTSTVDNDIVDTTEQVTACKLLGVTEYSRGANSSSCSDVPLETHDACVSRNLFEELDSSLADNESDSPSSRQCNTFVTNFKLVDSFWLESDSFLNSPETKSLAKFDSNDHSNEFRGDSGACCFSLNLIPDRKKSNEDEMQTRQGVYNAKVVNTVIDSKSASDCHSALLPNFDHPNDDLQSLSACNVHLSLADKMKLKFGKKTIANLLPHTKQ